MSSMRPLADSGRRLTLALSASVEVDISAEEYAAGTLYFQTVDPGVVFIIRFGNSPVPAVSLPAAGTPGDRGDTPHIGPGVWEFDVSGNAFRVELIAVTGGGPITAYMCFGTRVKDRRLRVLG